MTHDPHLPTLEEIMNGSPFDIIDSPWGHIERWRASTLATGTMGALHNVYDIIRTDAAAADARSDAEEARVALLKDVHKKLDALTTRVDAIVSGLEAAQAKARDDAARQAKFDEEPIELPPDIGGDDTHIPTGELHELPPTELQEDPPAQPDAGVPTSYGNVPTSYVRAVPHDQAGALPEQLKDLPVPPETEPQGSVFPQPTAIQANES
jgi:hypothetical protein